MRGELPAPHVDHRAKLLGNTLQASAHAKHTICRCWWCCSATWCGSVCITQYQGIQPARTSSWRALHECLACGVAVQGIQMQPDTVTQFQDDIYAGRWDEALTLLPQLTFDAGVALQASPATVSKGFLSVLGVCSASCSPCSGAHTLQFMWPSASCAACSEGFSGL